MLFEMKKTNTDRRPMDPKHQERFAELQRKSRPEYERIRQAMIESERRAERIFVRDTPY